MRRLDKDKNRPNSDLFKKKKNGIPLLHYFQIQDSLESSPPTHTHTSTLMFCFFNLDLEPLMSGPFLITGLCTFSPKLTSSSSSPCNHHYYYCCCCWTLVSFCQGICYSYCCLWTSWKVVKLTRSIFCLKPKTYKSSHNSLYISGEIIFIFTSILYFFLLDYF